MGRKLEDYIKLYGDEEGRIIHKEKNKGRGITLEKYIVKYGPEEGIEKYNKWKSAFNGKYTLGWFISKYGESQGPIEYNKKNRKSDINYKAFKDKGYSDKEIEIKLESHAEKSKITLNNMISKYGLEEGTLRYNNWKSKRRTTNPRCIEYWLLKGYNKKEARVKISDIQGKCSGLTKQIELYGLEEGTLRYQDYIIRKTRNCKITPGKSSKLEERFIDLILSWYDDQEFLFYYNKYNRIYRMDFPTKWYEPDFLDTKNMKIIEVYGDLWHRNPDIYSKDHYFNESTSEEIWLKDNERIAYLKSLGYDVLIIWETEIEKDFENTVIKTKQFLKIN